jgi:hypothetical protein
VIAKSAEDAKVTAPDAELFELFGSGVLAVTVAVSSISPPFWAEKVTVIVALPPAGRVPIGQLNVALETALKIVLGEQIPEELTAETTVNAVLPIMLSVTTVF